VVIDAGAHRGEFSAEIIRRFGCQCHAIEANPEFAKKLGVIGAASVTMAALSADVGHANLHVSVNLEASTLFADAVTRTTIEVETISLSALIQRLGITQIDLLKLDIEGAEFELIGSTPDDTLKRVGQITVEFHDFMPTFCARGLYENARARLSELGFDCCNMAFRTHGDVLFLNRERLGLDRLQSIYARRLARYFEKAKASLSKLR
jgi:FkbM family methyltransferase